MNNPKPNPKFHPRIIKLEQDDKDLLQKGLKSCLPPADRKHAEEDLAVELATKIGLSSTVHDATAKVLREYPVQTMDRPLKASISRIKKKLKLTDSIALKADKGRNHYDQVIYKVLQDCGASANKNFNIGKHVLEVRSLVNDCKFILNKPAFRKSVIHPNPMTPPLYGVPKVHKEGHPMRPIVSYNTAPTYGIAKIIDAWFNFVNSSRSLKFLGRAKE